MSLNTAQTQDTSSEGEGVTDEYQSDDDCEDEYESEEEYGSESDDDCEDEYDSEEEYGSGDDSQGRSKKPVLGRGWHWSDNKVTTWKLGRKWAVGESVSVTGSNLLIGLRGEVLAEGRDEILVYTKIPVGEDKGYHGYRLKAKCFKKIELTPEFAESDKDFRFHPDINDKDFRFLAELVDVEYREAHRNDMFTEWRIGDRVEVVKSGALYNWRRGVIQQVQDEKVKLSWGGGGAILDKDQVPCSRQTLEIFCETNQQDIV